MTLLEAQHTRPLTPYEQYHDGLSMAFHWLTVLLLMATFGAIWAMDRASDGDTADLLLTVHRSAGVLIWVVTLARLVWKKTHARSPAMPVRMPIAQRWAARGNEYALYLLLLAQPVTGFLQSIARGDPFSVLGLPVPTVMPLDGPKAHFFHEFHEKSATVLLLLVGLHACAAIFHGLVLRDSVLRSMLPIWPSPTKKRLVYRKYSEASDARR
jgi:cytochrome b561